MLFLAHLIARRFRALGRSSFVTALEVEKAVLRHQLAVLAVTYLGGLIHEYHRVAWSFAANQRVERGIPILTAVTVPLRRSARSPSTRPFGLL